MKTRIRIGRAASVLVALAGLSGCYLGNYESPNPPTQVFYYATQPESFTVSITSSSGATQNTQVEPTQDLLPPDVTTFFTDPVELFINNLSTGESYAFSPTTVVPQENFGPIYINGSQLTSSSPPSYAPFWPDSNGNLDTTCEISNSYSLTGSTTGLGSTPSTADSPIGDVTLSGRLQFQLNYTVSFQGSGCSTILTDMYNCFESVSACPGSTSADQAANNSSVASLYDPYIVTWGAMQPSAIQTTQSMVYQVTYQ